ELNVTIPIEDELKGVDGIKEYTSISMENLSEIQVTMESDVSDLEKVKQDIRRAVDNVTTLPAEIKNKPYIWEWKVQNFPVIEVALSSDKLTERQLVNRTKELKKQIQNLSMVSKANTKGINDREVQIKVDIDKLNANHLSFNDIILTLKSQNINVAGGNLESYISEKGIITVSRFESIKDVENAILRSNFEGNKISLKEVAKVVDTYEKKTSIIRYNGRKGFGLTIIKKENADIIRTISQVKECVKKYAESAKGKNIIFDYANDMSEETRNKLSIVLNNALIGLALVVIILFLFLNYKTAIWTTVGLPVSIFLAVVFMYITGVTLNTISLSGIIIVLGMLVDDAIIIAENIYRHHLDGKSWKEAALDGVYEVSLPVMATITTTIIAFLPILFMSGSAGDFAYEIPLVIAFTLLASLFEAFFILPQHLSHTRIRQKKIKKKKERSADKKLFIWLENKYKPLIRLALQKRYFLVLIFIALLAVSGWHAVTNMKFVMFDEDQAKIFYIMGQTKRGSSLKKTADDIRAVEKALKEYPKNVIESFITQVGQGMFGGSEDSNYFTIIVYMTSANIRKITAREMIRELTDKMSGIKVIKKFQFYVDAGGPPAGRPIELEIVSNNDKQRIHALKDLRSIFEIKLSYKSGYFNKVLLKKLKNEEDRKFVSRIFKRNNISGTFDFRKNILSLKEGLSKSYKKNVFENQVLGGLKDKEDTAFLKKAFELNIKKGQYYFKSGSSKKRIRTGEILSGIYRKVMQRYRGLLTKAGLFIGTYEVDDNYETGKDELRIKLNYQRIARFGLYAHQVAEAIRTAFNGTVVTYLQTQEERIGYRVMLGDRFRRNRRTLNKIKISNTQGRLIPIRDLIHIREKKSIKRLFHYNGDRTIKISANIDQNTSPVNVFTILNKKLEKISGKYTGVTFKIMGEAEESAKTMESLGMAFMVAIVAIYFLLVLLFNSFSQPLIVIAAIPFGLIGVIIAYTIHGTNFSMFGLLGIIGLAGVVVNDSLVLMDFINTKRKNAKNKNLIDMVIEAARTRLRPILLTTVTTAAGLLPTAYGIGGYDFTVGPMVLAISWGLVFATTLTLFLIPALYMIDNDIRRLFKRKKA
ncbi:MAG: efflux RND transporter permease subunit, partial [Spirochaetes bacterium]|nr:efflux RND transporter permease subunit [Spirochaetota bacterium]